MSQTSAVWHTNVGMRLRIPSGLISITLLMACLGGCGSSAPAYCQSLEHSTSLGELKGALIDLATSATEDKGRSTIRSAAGDLKNIGDDAPSPIRTDFANAASALDSLARNGISNAAAVRAVNDSLTSLGSEVESQCHFPLS